MKQNYCNRKKRKENDLLIVVSTTLNLYIFKSRYPSTAQLQNVLIRMHTCGSDLILATGVWYIHTNKWIRRIMGEDCWMMVEGRFKNSFVIIDNFFS